MKSFLHFAVYKHDLVIYDNLLISRHFITLKDNDNIIAFTDYHQYIRSFTNKSIKKITHDGNKKFYYVVQLLNYAFFDKYHIKSLNDLNIDIIKNFLNDYSMGNLPNDTKTRCESTVNKCINIIIDFLNAFYEANKSSCSFKPAELFKTIEIRNSKGKIIKKQIPAFEVLYVPKYKNIFRDLPETAFTILFQLIIERHKQILMVSALSAFAGLRPSESCNVRRNDSNLGPGIKFEIVNNEIKDILIDLRSEQNLRSDLKPVGKIKKERIQHVYPAFRNIFYECYKIYMEYIAGRKYENEYGPLSINSRGMAMTYNVYTYHFNKMIKELIPRLLNSNDAEAINYGYLLQENKLSPHVFRHWFSVKLTLYGEDISGLMHWRGDSSPESAITYKQNKSDLERQYAKVNNEIFDYNIWRSNKMFGDSI